MLKRTGFLSVFNDSQIQLYQSESHDGDAATQPQPKTAVSPGLYMRLRSSMSLVEESWRLQYSY